MKLKSKLIKPIANIVNIGISNSRTKTIDIQKRILKELISKAKHTVFGVDHNFKENVLYKNFKDNVPVRDYEELKPYFDKIVAGEEDVFWKGKPIYFAKTSGTTSGAKYIPITKESINHHIVAARNALFAYVSETNNSSFFDGKMIFLQGSPVLTDTNGINTGRLSGIVYHHVPNWLVKNRKPSYETNCIDDWETKLDAIVEETYQENMTLISGIPPWCIMYFEKLIEKTGKRNIQDIFPNFKLFIYGGVNYEPYREKIEQLIGFKINTIETYPASEGFFAFQNSQKSNELLLNINAGIYYEFIAVNEFYDENPNRINLEEVELGVNYVLIVSTNAGLWAYNTGDTIKFTSLSPFKILVTGRLKHYISAFGEHVIAEEVDYAISKASKEFDIIIQEYTVAPYVSKIEGEGSYHDWYVETKNEIKNMDAFAKFIDSLLQEKNSYYKDLRKGNILDQPKVNIIVIDGFKNYQKQIGKFGGQNKVVHLSNSREIVNKLSKFVKKD